MSKKGEAVIIISDLHNNSTVGLSTSRYLKDDGEAVTFNKSRRFLKRAWEMCWVDILDMAKGHHRTLVLNGDAVNLYQAARGSQYLSINPNDVKRNTIELLEPKVKEVDDFIMIRGTESHVGGSGYMEEMIADDLGAIRSDEDDAETASWWHFRGMFGGVKFDIAHFTRMGGLPWTAPNSAIKVAFETMTDYRDWNEIPPDLVIRSHQHRFADSGRNYPTRAIFTPCWQNRPAYLTAGGKVNKRPQYGAVVFLCEDADYEWERFIYRPVRGKPWKKKSK